MRKLNVNPNSIMSRSQKSIPQPKKVAPPSVPDMYRYNQSPQSPSQLKEKDNDDGGFKRHLMEPLSPSCLTVSYQRRSADPISHKAAVYYHQQYGLQEDQGIDLTQSPGRDSPGSSSGSAGSGSRHSTVSLDSGRSSSYLTGSVDRMSTQSDHDMIVNWLLMLNSDDYLPYASNFSSAGYDLGTIARMTPEDLTAIGITNPHHREVIKSHIDELQVNDSLPHYVPGSIDEWLRLLRLEEYIIPLQNEGFQSVRDMTKLNEEDLEDIGIVKLGHQKKILLAIKRVKDILSGKVVVPCVNFCCQPQPQPAIAIGPIYTQSQHHDEQITHMPAKTTFFDPRMLPDHNISPYSINQMPHMANFQHHPPMSHAMQSWRRSYDDGDITPTNEIMEAKNETSSGGGTLPRQQRQTKRSVTPVKIDLPPQQPLFNTNYTAEALKQMSMYYSTPQPTLAQRSEMELCQKVEKCYIDGTNVHYRPQYVTPNYQQMMYQHQMLQQQQQPAFGKLYAGQTHQTQAEVHVEHSQVEVCMSNSSIDSIDQIPFANENAGTIKQRALNRHDLPQSASSSSTSSSNSSASTAIPLCSSGARVTSPATTECDTNLDDPDDSDTVFNDINIMLNKLNGEIDIMIEHGANGENNGEN
ncbi:hypothetical protein PVAND_016697 [Polypedilum vanderplanki]|uniref:SAM domain-containing protein n=1 Tax=Polypedilum vanderplanki TaxID=319348 RepID=A0A9J6BGD0_POLVA|nr:hypothetical protein PVAND_016697 [Polypedilum vanderplanki]